MLLSTLRSAASDFCRVPVCGHPLRDTGLKAGVHARTQQGPVERGSYSQQSRDFHNAFGMGVQVTSVFSYLPTTVAEAAGQGHVLGFLLLTVLSYWMRRDRPPVFTLQKPEQQKVMPS